MDLENGGCMERFGKFCYTNGGGRANSISAAIVHFTWETFREVSMILMRKRVSLKLKRKVV